MSDFHTTLQREKFVISEVADKDDGEVADDITAFSNRMAITLHDPLAGVTEAFVVRAQTMHVCIRFSAFIMREFKRSGSLLARKKAYDWSHAYKVVTRGYEQKWNKDLWAAVYHNGKTVFSDGAATRHPFLDVIEKCDAKNKDEYEKSVDIAKDAFRQAGKDVSIDHDVHIALIANVTEHKARCGLVSRAPNKTTTFSFTVNSEEGLAFDPGRILSVCAAFLEAMQLAYFVGLTRQRREFGVFDSKHPDTKRGDESSKRLGHLNFAINKFETENEVTYRPERPDFSGLIDEVQDFARENLNIKRERQRAADILEWWTEKHSASE